MRQLSLLSQHYIGASHRRNTNTPATPRTAKPDTFAPTLAPEPTSFLVGLALALDEDCAAESAALVALLLEPLLLLPVDEGEDVLVAW